MILPSDAMIGTREIINTIWFICIYGLMAVPLTLSYRITKIINFAHGIYITLGAYSTIIATLLIGNKMSPFIAFPISFIVGAVLAVIIHILVFKPLIKRKSNEVTLMVASMGAWIFVKYAFYAVLNVLQKTYLKSLFYTTPRFDFPDNISLLGYTIDADFVFIFILTGCLLGGLGYFLTKFKLGLAIRSVADNPELSEISGISKETVMTITWIISGGLAALGGFALSMFSYVSPETGDILILQVFACAVLGGLASLPLTLGGAIFVSFSENILIVFLNRYLGVALSFRPFLSFFALLLAILIRPPGGTSGGLPYRYNIRKLLRRGKTDV
jgi:branched-subunit amino acid ABC-type transport system permease component